MSVFYYEPFYDIERLFDEALGSGNQQVARRGVENTDGAVRAWKPKMDLHEDAEKNVVTATFELPGLKKEDVQIDVENGRLSISAESKQSTEREEGGYAIKERRYGKLSRTLQLPRGTKEEDIKAGMENGVLTVTFPKAGPETAPKKITIA
ncbi:Heat shock protein 16 [Hypsizygus marmoreus]|uniref:Heat shock protein 16 n=1 Tax=Hypsizygus marmoreus TaxID=39966 RepID=A0A369KA26_HYPMA|nr:Heat shock protein 16 [Hypsizygus marmoreus]